MTPAHGRPRLLLVPPDRVGGSRRRGGRVLRARGALAATEALGRHLRPRRIRSERTQRHRRGGGAVHQQPEYVRPRVVAGDVEIESRLHHTGEVEVRDQDLLAPEVRPRKVVAKRPDDRAAAPRQHVRRVRQLPRTSRSAGYIALVRYWQHESTKHRPSQAM